MKDKLIYYRPDQRDAEALTPSQKKRLVRVWGTKGKPYNHFETLDIDYSYKTGLHKVTEILATIQCNERLNNRLDELLERIKTKGFKESKNTYVGDSKTVEAGIMCKIVFDAIELFNKDSDEKIDNYNFPMREIYRIHSIPYKGIMDKVKKSEENIGVIEKPKKIYDIKYDLSYSGDQQSSYKFYYVKGELRYSFRDSTKKTAYDKFPYLGKLYDVSEHGYVQIYVYDYFKSDWALQNVVDYLIKEKSLTLSK